MSDESAEPANQYITGGDAARGSFGVIGDPVAHSRSPELHEAWLRAAGLDGRYQKLHIPKDELVLRGPQLRYQFEGLNVTIPHKVAILGYVETLDADARAAGAANLLYRGEGGAWTAGNTDGAGFVRAVELATGAGVSGRDVAILGAGGAARAIAAALVSERVMSLTFLNRSPERADELVRQVGEGRTGLLHPGCLLEVEAPIDLVVNTLPPAAEPLLEQLDLSSLSDSAMVLDINYYQEHPALLRRADERALYGMDGRGMFLQQAALSFQRWTGVEPDIELGMDLLGM